MPTSRPQPLATRGRYMRNGPNNALLNSPDGYMSQFPPIQWVGGAGGNPLAPTAWWEGSDSGWPIGPDPSGAGSLAVVTRATSLIVGPLTAAPFRVNATGTVGDPVAPPRWISDPQLLRQDSRFIDAVLPAVTRLPRSLFWESWVRNALWYGLGAFIFREDESGQPLAGTLQLVDPRFLYTERPDDGPPVWTIGDGTDSAQFDRDGYLRFESITYRICVLRNPLSPIDAEGMSQGVFAMNPSAFRLAGQVQEYMSGTFRDGTPSGYLTIETPGATQAQVSELARSWMAAHGNDRRSIAVLNAVTRFTPVSLTPVDAAVVEVKGLAIADVAYAFGMDPMTLGVSLAGSSTYTNIRDAWSNHRDYALSPWIAAVQDTLSALLAGSQGIAINLDQFANPPLSERVTTGAAAVAAGLMTVDEWRALEGLPPMPVQEQPAPEPVPEPEPTPEPAVTNEERTAGPRLAWRR